MDLDRVFSRIKSKYPWFLRNRWTHVLEFQNLSDNKYISKMGGSNPFRSSNFQWPKCGQIHDGNGQVCGEQKKFVCQIIFIDLPDEMKDYIGMDSGMLQIFRCGLSNSGKLEDLDMKLIPKKEMIPRLKTLAAINIYKKKVNTDKLPVNLVKFVENTNEKFKEYNPYNLEMQVQTWRKSEFKEIPSSHELKGMAADDELLQSVPRYDYELIYTRLPMSIPEDRLTKLGGYIKDMGGGGREHYPQCLDCGQPKNKVLLKMNNFYITLCPGCGEPGSVP